MSIRRTVLITVTLAAFLLLSACSKPASNAPQRCTLTVKQAPEVRGFRLGMGYKELQERFPQLKSPSKDERLGGYGLAKLTIEVGSFRPNSKEVVLKNVGLHDLYNEEKFPDLRDVRQIDLTFVDEQVASFEITYDPVTDDKFAAEFFEKVADSLKPVPYQDWQLNGSQFKRQLACEGFIARAEIDMKTENIPDIQKVIGVYTPSFGLEEVEAMKRPQARRDEAYKKFAADKAAAEENRRRDFKP